MAMLMEVVVGGVKAMVVLVAVGVVFFHTYVCGGDGGT